MAGMDDYDDDDEEEILMTKAFVVPYKKNVNTSIPPTNGEEYLQHVIYEASKCEAVKIADVSNLKRNPVKVKTIVEKSPVASKFAPSLEWQQVQLCDFSDIRLYLAKCRLQKIPSVPLPHAGQERQWYNFFITEQRPPLLSVVLSLSQPLLGRLLDYHLLWFDKALLDNQGRWLYTILSCLSLPLTPDVCSSLRDLARKCAQIRSEKETEDSEVTILNLLICLVGRYFGQLDLAD